MKKILKVVLALMMAFGIQVATLENVNAAETSILPDGEYTVSTGLKNASNIENDSMANGALVDQGKLIVKDGNWSLIAEFTTLDFADMHLMYGNAYDIQYYEDGLNSELHDVTVLTTRDEVKSSTWIGESVSDPDGYFEINTINGAVGKIEVPITTNTSGIYLRLKVEAMDDLFPTGVDAYLSFSLGDAVADALTTTIAKAEALVANDYTAASYSALQTAITNAKASVEGSNDQKIAQTEALNIAIANLVKVYTLSDGTYEVKKEVLSTTGGVSMAGNAITKAIITAQNNALTVSLDMTSLGGTWVEGLAYYNGGEYIQAEASQREEGNITQFQFVLPENVKETMIQFSYTIPTGATHKQVAILSLDLDNPIKINTSVFASDGTYNVDVALWNATQNATSMANGALDTKATIVVKNGVATMYINTKEMTMGTIKAWLEELYIGSINEDYKANPATAYATNSDGKVTMWSFALPNEEEFFDVVVNPHVEIMGNVDIAARIKVDYETLVKVSDSFDSPDKTSDNVDDTTVSEATDNNSDSTKSDSVKTGDNVNMELMGGLLISLLALITYYTKKKLCK